MTALSVEPFLNQDTQSPVWRSQRTLRALGVTVAYLATGLGGLQLAFVSHAVTLFWPPSGIAFAAIWLGGNRMAPAILAGAFGVNCWVFQSAYPAALIAFGNVLPALFGVKQLRRLLARHDNPGELQRVVLFILVGALASTTISASVGTLVVHLLSHPDGSLQSTWLVWWLGDAMGVLIVAPPILLWQRFAGQPLRWQLVLHALAFCAMGLLLIAGLLLIQAPIWAVELCKLLTLLLSLWAGARFGLAGPAGMTLLMALGAIGVTLLGVGPFVRGDFYDRFAQVHSYLFAEALAGMLLAAALSDLRRTLVSEREARSQAEVASANRLRLFNMISHDVRTPLAGMLGTLQALAQGPLTAAQQDRLQRGLRAGTTLTKLVNDILDVARVDTNRIRLDPAPFDLLQSLRDVLLLHQDAAVAKSLGLQLEMIGRVPPLVWGDRVRIEQLVGNLVNNAVSYTSAGNVTVRVHWDSVADRIHLEVRDTGPGLALPAGTGGEFDPTLIPTGQSTGLGLGLHIARGLVDLMQGRLTYQGDAANGSCFRIQLPTPAVVTAEVAAGGPRAASLCGTDACDGAAVAAVPPATAASRHILLVEDDEIARDTATALLQLQGFTVTPAGRAAEALVLARTLVPDVVLIDLDLGPGQPDGWSAVRSIRALPGPVGQIRIVALTGDAVAAAALSRPDATIDGVWIKPLVMTADFLALLTAGVTR